MTARTAAVPPRRLTREDWNRLLDLARTGASVRYASQVMRLDRKTVRKCFDNGLPSQEWGKVSIRKLIEEEQVAARAHRAQLQAAMGTAPVDTAGEESAKADAIKARAEEGKIIVVARANALGLLSVSSRLSVVAVVLAKKLENALQNYTVGEDEFVNTEGKTIKRTKNLTPGQALTLLRSVAGMASQAVDVGKQAMEMERLWMGDPNKIEAGKEADEASTLTVEDAMAELAEVSNTVDRMRAAGFKVIEGGAITPPPDDEDGDDDGDDEVAAGWVDDEPSAGPEPEDTKEIDEP